MILERLLIVDGHNLLFQMFFGMPARIYGKEHKPIHAVIGFVGALLKIIRLVEPSHVIVLFDSEVGSNRGALNLEYKANRIDYTQVADEDNPFLQLADIMKALNYMNIKYHEAAGCEADDIVASYIKKYRESIKICVASKDTDFLQFVDDNVSIMIYRGKDSFSYDRERVLERFGVKPELFADYKALMGDQADNIKGVPRIGPKTAAKLLKRYNGIEELLANTDSIEPQHIRDSIEAHRSKILCNMELIQLKGEENLPFGLQELRYDLPADNIGTTNILKALQIT